MIESEKIECEYIPFEPIRCPNCGGDDTDLDKLSGVWECFDCLHLWHYDEADAPEAEPSQTCRRCDGSGEIADPNDWGNWGLEPIGGSLTCPCCQGTGKI